MRYVLAIVLCIFSTSALAGGWRSGDVAQFRLICEKIQDLAGILKIKNPEEGFEYLKRMGREGKCAFFPNGSFEATLIDKLIEADMVDGPSEIWSAEVSATDGSKITGFVLVDARQGPQRTGKEA